MRGGINDTRKFSRLLSSQHPKVFPKSQVCHHIKGEEVSPLSHIHRPTLFRWLDGVFAERKFEKRLYMENNVFFHRCQRVINEGRCKNSPLLRVQLTVPSIERAFASRMLDCRLVEAGLGDVLVHSVNICSSQPTLLDMAPNRSDCEPLTAATSSIVNMFGATRTNFPIVLQVKKLTYAFKSCGEQTIFLMCPVRVQVLVANIGVVNCIPVCDSCKEWSGIFG